MEEQVRKKACVQEIQNFFFLRSVQGHRNQYKFKQVDGVSVNGLASDFGENVLSWKKLTGYKST